MKWQRIFLIVCLGALAGLIYGSLFGFVFGLIVPEWFARWRNWNPIWVATFLGAKAGVKLGGGLACFALILSAFGRWKKIGEEDKVVPKP